MDGSSLATCAQIQLPMTYALLFAQQRMAPFERMNRGVEFAIEQVQGDNHGQHKMLSWIAGCCPVPDARSIG